MHRRWLTIGLAAILIGACRGPSAPPSPPSSEPTARPSPQAPPVGATTGQPTALSSNLAQGMPASASQSTSDQPPVFAFDGRADTVWSAGGHPTQWIEVDLGAAFALDRVSLRTAQSPAGATTHRVWGRARDEPLRRLGEFKSETSDDQLLELSSAADWPVVRYLRIETTESPSWVAWREIEVYGAPATVTQPVVDAILHNGNLLTMDDGQPTAQAIALSADRIVAVGSDAEILPLAGSTTQVIDLGGLTVTPGFIDAHTHRLGDLGMLGVSTVEEAIDSGIRLGWTSLHELTVNEDRLATLRRLDRAGQLRLRVAGYLQASWEDAIFDWYKQSTPHEVVSPYLQFPGVKLRADQEWGEWEYFDEATLTRLILEAHRLGWQVAVHSFAPQSNEMALNAFEKALNGEPNALYRHRLEHTGIVTDDQLARMQRMGIIASVPTAGAQFYAEDETFKQYIPPEMWPWTVRTRDFLEAGVPTAGHTDVPWSSFDWRHGVRPTHLGSAMWAIHSAVTRQDAYSPRPLAAWEEAQRVSVDEALHLHTIYAAYAAFDEARLGSLTPGKLADLVILSASPLDVPVDDIPEIEVLMTMIGGKTEFCQAGMETLCP